MFHPEPKPGLRGAPANCPTRAPCVPDQLPQLSLSATSRDHPPARRARRRRGLQRRCGDPAPQGRL